MIDLSFLANKESVSFQGNWITGQEILLMDYPRNITFEFPKKGIVALIKRLFKNKDGWQEISKKVKIGKPEYSKNEDGSYSVSIPMSVEAE